ncbi:MAG: S24/S26 family peptidase [Opitutaceae bacterium]
MEWTEAWKAAENEASQKTGAFVVCGSGSSMEPLYTAGTILVVAPTAFETLVAGSTVLYYNEDGTPVMHVLVAHTRNGWRVTGLNNDVHDYTPVTPKNLAGIVIHAFTPKGRPALGQVIRVATR